MRGLMVLGTLGLLLAGCAQPAPPSQGVGFGDYGSYQREAELTGAAPTGFAAPGTVATSPYGMATPTSPAPVPPGGIPSSALSAAGIGVAPVSSGPIGAPLPGVSSAAPYPGVSSAAPVAGAPAPTSGAFTSSVPLPAAPAPAGNGLVSVASSGVAGDVNVMRATGLEASPSNAAPTLVGTVPGNTGGISDEQDFQAVSSRESIESDAARRAQQAAQYQVLQPQALPAPPADTGPNIVQYALSAPNSVGQPWYSRFVLFAREGRAERNCAKYRTADEAQRDFLARGGPDKDSLGLDPDGDGFACAWDPAPFRAAVGRG
ncbi:hypothetical protein Rumeso_01923 [Rubellimicrobium mesophilum DSM 19309]|uniref:Excalibur calcium-binding domain-containing protein n=1 Tax=Rubellimicrobium mesophilum DSM 19309 TaxID=442562 RepID=A0A017HPU4_9RHOB|nr:hypothetical protein [Rubellimicrobium mesophilum]EYD76502.1 hypothetical protein Rumeso_01923 [Rubellimicrobium mesophilum DSM 19309]